MTSQVVDLVAPDEGLPTSVSSTQAEWTIGEEGAVT